MVPTEALPPATPLTDQLTVVLVLPVTVAVNCCDSPVSIVAADGLTETVMAGGGGGGGGPATEPPPQALCKVARAARHSGRYLRTSCLRDAMVLSTDSNAEPENPKGPGKLRDCGRSRASGQ